MDNSYGHSNHWLWFTVPIVILLAIAAGSGVFVNGLYRDTAYFARQAVAQDFVSLVIVLPTLIITAVFAHRRSLHAQLIWLGVMVYLIYSYVIAAFVVKYNPLFLVYVALLGLSGYGLIVGLVKIDMDGIKACATKRAPIKAVSTYLGILAILFYFLWLSEAIPALVAGKVPQSVVDNGTPTNAVYVLDMAWVLPAFLITAVSLWRKHALGYTLAGTMLSYIVLLISAILSIVVFLSRDGQPIILPQAVIFGVLFIISLGILIWYMIGLKSPQIGSTKQG